MRGLLIVLAFIGVVGGGSYAVRTYAPHYLPDEWTSDAVLAQRMRARMGEIERADAFFLKFEALFPADYNELMTQLVALYRRGGDRTQARTLGDRYIRSFIEDNFHHVSAAEPAVMMEIARAIGAGASVLRQENAVLCGEAFRAGQGFSLSVEGMSPETQDAFMRIGLLMLDGIASGKRAPTAYPEPTDAQLLALFNRYVASGGDGAALNGFVSGAELRSMPAETVCAVVDGMWRAALQAEDDFVPRFLSYSLSQPGG